jgi:membrane-associated phospholipid phosphatase
MTAKMIDSERVLPPCVLHLGCLMLLLVIGWSQAGFAQQPDAPTPQTTAQPDSANTPPAPLPPQPQLPLGGPKVEHLLDKEQHSEVTVGKVPRNIIRDGGHIVVAPLYLRTGDLKWLAPLAGASIAAFATDTHTMTQVVSRNPSFNNVSINVSDGLRDGLIAAPIAMAGIGIGTHNERVRETGLLGSEAMVDAIIVDEIAKLASFRERPLVDNGQGEFYVAKAGVDSSFVSGHAMVAWSSAAVIAGETHSRWLQVGVYTAATGVSLTRVMGQEHFPTDVLIGSAAGWLIGHYVYRAHHHKILSIDIH